MGPPPWNGMALRNAEPLRVRFSRGGGALGWVTALSLGTYVGFFAIGLGPGQAPAMTQWQQPCCMPTILTPCGLHRP